MSRTLKQRFGRWLFAHLPITRFLFDQLRFEANAWLVRFQNAVLPSRRRRLRQIRAMRHVLVNVACGPQMLDGFINVELLGPPPRVRWDCRRSVPRRRRRARRGSASSTSSSTSSRASICRRFCGTAAARSSRAGCCA